MGGGFSFIHNFYQGAVNSRANIHFTEADEADLIFIPSSSMVKKSDTVSELKDKGKKVVLRVDNAVKDSRNRGAGMGKMKRIAMLSDLVIYQSQWSIRYLQPFLRAKNIIQIPNGVNADIFNNRGIKYEYGKNKPVYLYSRFSRDETKRWEKAWYDYQMIQRENPDALLLIVGSFSDEVRAYNFDFFMDENYKYLGVIESPEEMARIYRSADYLLAPYYNDCYSNTYCEFVSCHNGKTDCLYDPDMTGGTPEIIQDGVIDISEMVVNYYKEFENVILS